MALRISRARAAVGGTTLALTLLLAPAAAEARGRHEGAPDAAAAARAADWRADWARHVAEERAAWAARAGRMAVPGPAHDGQPGPVPWPATTSTTSTMPPTTPPTTAPRPDDETLSAADQAFLATAAQAAKFEVRSGAVAAARGTDCGLRLYGAAMAVEHSVQSLDERHVARRADATLPTDVTAAQAAQLEALRSLSGAEFDRAYAALAVTSHEQAEALFATAATSADNPRVRMFAARWLPGVRRHLAVARKLQADVADEGTTTTTTSTTSTTTTSTTMPPMDHSRA